MSLPERLASLITNHSRIAIAAMLVLTLALGSGAGMVEQSSSLDQFQSDNEEVDAQSYIDENFVPPGEENISQVQVIVRNDDGNVLSKESLLSSLRYQRSLLDNESVNATLDQDQPATGVSNLVAITAHSQERAAELEARTAPLSDALNTTVGLQRQYAQLNASYQQGEINQSTYQAQSAEIERSMTATRADATADLSAERSARFNASAAAVRNATNQQALLQARYDNDEINQSTYEERSAELDEQLQEAYRQGTRGVFAEEFRALQSQENRPSIDEQIEQLESMSEDEVEALVGSTLDPDSGQGIAYQLMSTSYEPGETTADARMMLVRQEVADAGNAQTGEASDVLIDSQSAMQNLADDPASTDEYVVFGFGLISDEMNRSMGDSLAIVGPLAMLFVLLTLIVAYRDLLDIALGFVGIVAVLLWTFGFMGWAGITFNMIFIAVPVLLIGLSVDYAIHVFMRHREQRQERGAAASDGARPAMKVALTGVGVTLVWVTATTAIGFLSNLVSPLGPIRDFGIVSSVGIFSALLIFGILVPAVKIEIDEFLEARGFDRKKRAFGTGGGRLAGALSTGETLARKAPLAVIAIALVISVAGGAAATQVDTSFQQEDFIADDPPDWMNSLPGPLEPGEYTAKDHMNYVYDNFVVQDSQGEILVRGDGVTDPETLHRIADAEGEAAEMDTAVVLSNGEADVRSPLTAMEDARDNETFNATFTAADTDGDGVPEQNVEAVYDALYDTAPTEAAQVVYRTDGGEYEALKMSVSVKGGASTGAITEDVRGVADGIDDESASTSRSAVATGTPIVNEVVQNELLDTVLQSLLVTLVTVFAFLAIVYRFQYGSATLGIVTLLPVALSVSWILGTMYLLGMPFNVLTGMITSLTIGLGVAYSIHISERYNIELDRQDDAWEAMRVSLTGTGGALLGSAATTVGGFGVLVFAIMPPLQQFGIITGMTIVYAFVASVIVLPSLLVVWTRYVGPSEALAASGGDPDDRDDADDAAPVDDDSAPADAGSAAADDGSEAAADRTTAASADGSDPPTSETTASPASDPIAETATGASSQETAVASAAGTGPEVTRTVSADAVRPGERFSVGLSVSGASGRVLLVEDAAGVGGHVTDISPSPTTYTQVGRTLYILWQSVPQIDLTMEYVADAPADATPGEQLAFDGHVVAGGDEHETDGVDALDVTSDELAVLRAGDEPTIDDLERAGELAREGELTEEELERLYRRWIVATAAQPSDRSDGANAGDARSMSPGAPEDE